MALACLPETGQDVGNQRDGDMSERNGEKGDGGDVVFLRSQCPVFVPRNGFTDAPSYAQLLSVWDNGPKPSFVLAWFAHELVILRGRNLGRHADGLRQRKAWEIEEYDEALLGPAAEGETVVTSIEFVYENIPRVLAELRGLLRKPEKARRPGGRSGAKKKRAA